MRDEADIWQRQAYMRARLDSRQTLDDTGLSDRDHRPDVAKLVDIRQKLLRPVESSQIDLKYAPGGLVDIEFAVSWGC